MWQCPKCKREFKKKEQPHSCKAVPIEDHFVGKEKAKELYDTLLRAIKEDVGKCKIISLPCCVHLFGNYDFLAALPKKDRLEIRFVLDKPQKAKRIKQVVKMSSKSFKICIDLDDEKEIDTQLIDWLEKSYHLKD